MRSALAVSRPDMPLEKISNLTFWSAVILSSLLAVVAALLSRNAELLPFPTWIAPAFLAGVTIIGATHEFVTNRVVPNHSASPASVQDADGSASLMEVDLTDMEANAEPPFLFEPADDDSADTWADARTLEPPDEPSDEDDDRMLDEVLTKLHAHGRESLTEHECAFLQRVSARYRHRQRST